MKTSDLFNAAFIIFNYDLTATSGNASHIYKVLGHFDSLMTALKELMCSLEYALVIFSQATCTA